MHPPTAVSRIKHISQPAEHLPAVTVEWDAAHYAEKLPKAPLNLRTKASNEKEAALRRRYAPLNGVTAPRPRTIVDMQALYWLGTFPEY